MKWVQWYKVDRPKPQCVYWVRQFDDVTGAKFKVVGYANNFCWRIWWGLQKQAFANWLVGRDFE